MSSDWILFTLILVSGFYMAWNIGANDVANAMGTSVGSGALSLRQAIILASLLEFSGAFFFGSHVSETIKNGIINASIFESNPQVLLLGMLAALIGTGFWLQIASYFGWPVSTTHSIVGAVIGFGALIGGWDAVYWGQTAFIFSSWLISPLLGAIFGYAIFQFIRRKIFFADHPLTAAKKILPLLVFAVFSLLVLLLMFKGLENLPYQFDLMESLFLAFSVATVASLISKLLIAKYAIAPAHDRSTPSEQVSLQLAAARKELAQAQTEPQAGSLVEELKGTITALEHSAEFDYTKKEFDLIEKMFGWLQILSACLMAFAHGANDVANAIGPFSAALFILSTGTVALQTEVPSWALALGGFGIVVGLATWGWRVIETIGKKITELTPTRGFSAEFAAAATVLLASRLGLPISTTHTLVGAVIGIGFARGIEALNLGMMRDIALSWIITIPAGALSAVSVYLILAYLFNVH